MNFANKTNATGARSTCEAVQFSCCSVSAMSASFLLLLWFLCLLTNTTSAQPAASTNSTPGRYLIIFETSFDMRRIEENATRTIGRMLSNGLDGQLKPGDSIGVWTFNNQLRAGRFPLQLWTPDSQAMITSNILAFLGSQSYTNFGRIERVLTQLQEVVKASEKITVLFITSSDIRLTGLPYEWEISQVQNRTRSEMRSKRMPFIIALRAHKGEYLGYSANVAPWPVEFPAFPPEPQVVTAPPVEIKKEEPQRPMAEPLIVIGKKPEPLPIVTNTPHPEQAGSVISRSDIIINQAVLTEPPVTAITSEPQVPLPVTNTAATTKDLPAETTPRVERKEPVAVKSDPPPLEVAAAQTSRSIQPANDPPGAAQQTTQPTELTPTPVSQPPQNPTIAQPALAIPAKSNANLLYLGAGMVVVAVAILVLYLQTRRRTPARGSLITRSLDGDKK
jgi:hypothetical protein